ncbi:MAG: ATP-binding protein, partial [Chloroflexota bacterium]
MGPPGTGKTRLALEVARSLASSFTDGAAFIQLAPLRDPRMLASYIGQSLGLREADGFPILDILRAVLRDRHLLLVLDNFEQLVAGAAVVSDLLQSCSRLTVLVTSRTALRCYGEHQFPVPPLGLPTEDDDSLAGAAACEAVQLFVDRAAAVQPDFQLTDDNWRAVARVCRQLDGLPLALELAAARVNALSVEQFQRRLGAHFGWLIASSAGVPDRHRTLQALLDWSYELLSESERALWRRLAVFSGGWTLEAAEEVCSGDRLVDVFEVLSSLVDHSLVLAQVQGNGVRYRFLETIREYGLTKLREVDEAGRFGARHLNWVLDLAERAEAGWAGPAQGEWLRRLAAEHDNVRAALEFACNQPGSTTSGLRVAGALWWFWLITGHHAEGRARIQDLLTSSLAHAATPGHKTARARALSAAATLAV